MCDVVVLPWAPSVRLHTDAFSIQRFYLLRAENTVTELSVCPVKQQQEIVPGQTPFTATGTCGEHSGKGAEPVEA